VLRALERLSDLRQQKKARTVARAQAVQAASAVATAKYNLVLQQTVMDYYTGALDPQHVSLGS